jgi:hypothetical protein
MVLGREFTFLFMHFVGMSVLMARTLRDAELKSSSVPRPLLLLERVCS